MIASTILDNNRAYLEVPVAADLADLAAVNLVNPVTAVVAFVITSTFSRAGSDSIMKKASAYAGRVSKGKCRHTANELSYLDLGRVSA
jgi:hypothetical protein